MKILKLIGLSFLIFSRIYAQTSDNIGFEFGDFSNWKGYRGICCGGSILNSGIKNGWHTLMKSQGYDTNTNNSVSFIAPHGDQYSVRLGNPNAGAEAERLSTSFLINQNNALLTYMYAVILQDSAGHTDNEKPKLQIRILNASGNPINEPCVNNTITAIPNSIDWSNKGDIYYKNWTEVSVDLRAYTGQVLTLEFTTQDCGQEGHFGYAYIDAYTSPYSILGSGCNHSDSIILTAPQGFIKYNWYPGRQTSKSITIKNPVVGDTFRVEVTNEGGCVYTIEKILGNISYPVVKANNDTTICLGSSIILTAHATGNGIRYYWNGLPPNPPSAAFKHVFPTVSTFYLVYVEDANGCIGPKSIDTVNVTVDRHLYFNLGPPKEVCPGTLVYFASHVKATQYLWTTNPTTAPYYSKDSAIAYKALKSIKFYLNVQDSLCSFISSVDVVVLSNSKLITFCEHDTVMTLFAPKASSYLWVKTGDTTQSFTVYNPKNSENYSVIMTGAPGCFDTLYYSFKKAFDPIPLIMHDTTICYGKEINMSGGGGYYYYWQSYPPGFYSDSCCNKILPDITRKYFLKVQSYDGCFADSVLSVLITVKKDAYYIFNNSYQTTCFGDLVSIKPNTNKGTFNWYSVPSGFYSNDTAINVISTKPITYILTHIQDGCTYSNKSIVDLYPRPNVNIVDYCSNDSEIVIVPQKKYSSFLWLPSRDTSNTFKIKTPPSLKKVWLNYTIKGGCSDTQEYIFNNIPNPKIFSLPDTTICIGASINLYAKGSKSYNHYYWFNEQNQLISNKMKPLVTPGLKSKYKVKVTNEIDCYGPQSLDSFTVTQDTSVLSELGNDTFICKGKQVRLAPIKGKGICTWTSDPPGFNNSYNPYVYVTPKTTTRYILQMKNSKCTGNQSDILVNVWELPFTNAGNDKKICSDSEVTLSVIYRPTYTYKWWSNRSTFLSNQHDIKVHPEYTTIYYVAVTDTNGCLNKDTIKVTSKPLPVINFNGLIKICEHTPFQLNAYNPNCSYQWSTGDTTPSIFIKHPGIYDVVVSNNGCIKQGHAEIEWLLKKDTLIIPNIFTPNNDGVNEMFTVITNNFQNYNLRIFNRWGQQIFISADPDYSWDGTIQGNPATQGVYFYLLDIKSNCEEAKSYSGTITIMR